MVYNSHSHKKNYFAKYSFMITPSLAKWSQYNVASGLWMLSLGLAPSIVMGWKQQVSVTNLPSDHDQPLEQVKPPSISSSEKQ